MNDVLAKLSNFSLQSSVQAQISMKFGMIVRVVTFNVAYQNLAILLKATPT